MSDAGALIFLVGRVIFALNFVAIAAPAHLKMSKMMQGFAKQMRFPAPVIAGWPSGLWLAACGLSVALGVWGDLGSLMIAVFVVIAGAFFHRFWEVEDAQKQTQKQLFWRNVTFLGAALILFVFYATSGHDLALTLTDPVFDLRP
jgi:uncharacterized membrane protein YphA (DoxX/SURF4 family)